MIKRIKNLIRKLIRTLIPVNEVQLKNNGVFSYKNYQIAYADAASMQSSINMLIERGINDFVPDVSNPRIIDCGSNIGVSILNYKIKYPQSRVIGFEPDPKLFSLLKRNVEHNKLANVEIEQKAIWVGKSKVSFLRDESDGGKILLGADGGGSNSHIIEIDAVDILDYVNEEVDLIKIDIEGAEYEVVLHLMKKSRWIKNIIIEVHYNSYSNDLLKLGSMLTALYENHYKIAINSLGVWRDLANWPEKLEHEYDQYFLIAASKSKR